MQTGGPDGDPDWELTNRDRVAAILIGLLGGFIVGLTSVGSGVFFGLTLLVVFPLRAHKVVGTDIFHAAVLLYVAGAAHWAAGNVDFGILFWLLLGSIPGVLIGGRLTLSIPEQRLRLLLAGVLGLAGIKLLNVPFAGTIVVVVLSLGPSCSSSGSRGTAGSASCAAAAQRLRPRRSSSLYHRAAMRTVWVSFDTIGRDCLEAAADVGAEIVGSRHAARADRPEPLGAVLVRRRRSAARGRAARDARRQRPTRPPRRSGSSSRS